MTDLAWASAEDAGGTAQVHCTTKNGEGWEGWLGV